MARLINQWTTLAAWAALMGIVWALFVPGGLSVSSFTLLSLTGPILLVTSSVLWSTHRPALSARQARVAADASDVARRGTK